MCRRSSINRACISYCAWATALALGSSQSNAAPFYMGADVSLLPFMQQQGVTFKQNGISAPGDQILYDAGANLFRVRIFVNPQTIYTNQNYGAIQSQAYDIALAQQLKANDPGAKLLLDFHYSDTWADPGTQTLPAAWASPSQSLSQLQGTVQSYTNNTLLAFKSAGVMPDMVQVGNEINSGMDFPTGQVAFSGSTQTQKNSWAAFGGLIKAGITGVRQAQGSGPKIQVGIHIANGDQGDGSPTGGEPYYFFGKLSDPNYGNVSPSLYDIMGVSFYPSATAGLSTLRTNLNELADVYNKNVMVLETDAPWKSTSAASDPAYPSTSAGQLQFLTDLRNTVQNVHNGDGLGVVYWYPESVQVGGFNIYNGGSTALFDSGYNALPALGAFNTTGLITATWIKNQGADWNTAGNWLGGRVPNGAGAEADLLSVITSPQLLSNSMAITLGTLRFNNANAYTVGGSGLLTMSVSSGTALISVVAGTHSISLPLTIASNTALNVASGAVLGINGPLTLNSGTSLYPTGTGTVNYSSSIALQSAAIITFANSLHSTSLSLTTSSGAFVAPHGTNPTTLVQFDQLSFGGSSGNWLGRVDLNNNDMIVHGGSLANVMGQVSQGFSGGNWNGAGGIVSSAAGGNGSHLTALGVILNGNTYGTAPGSLGLFDGVTPGVTDVLVRYTYYGDANLDGRVDGSDYTLIDNGFNNQLTGWYNGDFNYDGVVNGSDYTLIDNAFNTQGAGVVSPQAISTAEIGSISDTGAVPEPAMGLIALAGVILLGKRRIAQ